MNNRIIAPAKLTLSLKVTGTRQDGYHLIDAEMVTLDLHDVLTIQDAEQSLMTVGGLFAEGVPTDATNLCLQAAEFARRSVNIHLEKNIPHGGGLGGGSADAAAVLRWAGVSDAASTAAIGADVPFCLHGGRARVRGIGEIIDALPHVDRTFTIVAPPLHVSTPAVYEAWDQLGERETEGPNDLEPAALLVEPQLVWWRDEILERTGITPTLAGSGASWFIEGERDDALVDLIGEGAVVRVARTVEQM
jgi:4-diphosphocytidyl-2-C-methyl-D-erythritol kinase